MIATCLLITAVFSSYLYVEADFQAKDACSHDGPQSCLSDNLASEDTSVSLLQRHATLITLENPVTVLPGSAGTSVTSPQKGSAVFSPQEEQIWYDWLWYEWLLWYNNWWVTTWQYIGSSNYYVEPGTVDNKIKLSVSTMLIQEWWPLTMVLCGFVFLYVSLRIRIKSVELPEKARSCAFICQFLNFLGFSIVIVDSYKTALMLDGGITYSGAIIGIYMAGSGLGYVCSWILLHCVPNSWRSCPRPVLILGNFVGLMGCVGYGVIVFLVPVDPGADLSFLRVLLLVFRAFGGVSQGLCALFNRVILVRITPAEDRIQQAVRYSFFTQFGMGAGPLFAAMALFFIPAAAPAQIGIQHVSVVSTGAQLIAFILMVLMYPNISSCRDEVQCQDGGTDGETSMAADPHSFTKKRIVLTCVFIITVQSYIASGLESLTSLALEDNFHWQVTDVGLIVAFTYLLAIPVIIAFIYVKESARSVQWALGICIIQLMATLFLYPLPCFQSGWFLVFSDSIIFPLMTVGNGLFVGQMDMFKFPEGTIFNVNNRTLFSGILTNGVARMLGPIMARFLFAQSGLLGYASQQSVSIILCLLGFLTMYQTFGVPNLGLDTDPLDAKKAHQAPKELSLDESAQRLDEASKFGFNVGDRVLYQKQQGTVVGFASDRVRLQCGTAVYQCKPQDLSRPQESSFNGSARRLDEDTIMDFDAAAKEIKKLKSNPTTEEQLNLYKYFKQKTQGDIDIGKPGMFDPTGRAKWDAWDSVKGVAREDARRNYVKLVTALTEKYGTEQ